MGHIDIESVKFDLVGLDGVTSAGIGIEDGMETLVVTVFPLNDEHRGRVGDFVATVDPVGDFETVGDLPVVIKEDSYQLAAPRSHAPQDHRQRMRPVPGGVSIGTRSIQFAGATGTSAFVMTDGSERYLSSNNHVFTNVSNHDIGEPVVQPGIDDGGSVGPDTVGNLAGFVPVEDGVTADFAWASMDVGIDSSAFQLGEIGPSVADPNIGDDIVKSGRTTGVTRGTVSRTGVTIGVAWDNSVVTFTDVIESDMHIMGGDSGSPVFLDDSEPYTPAGLVFAKSNQTGASVCCLLSNAIQESGLSLVTDSTVTVTDCSPSTETLLPGQSMTVSATIDAPSPTDATVEFSINGTVMDTQSVTAPVSTTSRDIEHGELPEGSTVGISVGASPS